MTVMPQMEQNLQDFTDSYGIVKIELWKVLEQMSGDGKIPVLGLSEKAMDTLKKWLTQE
jgi:hypothetical protein